MEICDGVKGTQMGLEPPPPQKNGKNGTKNSVSNLKDSIHTYRKKDQTQRRRGIKRGRHTVESLGGQRS